MSRTPTVLVTAGNIRQESFKGILFAIHKEFENIESIIIFDSPESNKSASENHRERDIREYFKKADICTVLIEDDDLQKIIPNRISKYIHIYGIENLLIDLSNGQKLTTSVLYAVATISKIPNIFVLELNGRVEEGKTLEDYKRGEFWDYKSVEPLKEILNISRSAQLELIYYRERIRGIIDRLKKNGADFVSAFESDLNQCLISYFSLESDAEREREQTHYRDLAARLGKVVEGITRDHFYPYCANKELVNSGLKKFSDMIGQLVHKWKEYDSALQQDECDKLKGEGDFIRKTLAMPGLLEVARIYRNSGAHSGRRLIYAKEDIRLLLDITLLIFEKLLDTKVFNG